MKKLFFIIIFFISIPNINAKKEVVTLSKCVDGDTVWLMKNDEKIKVRFLAIDTPESTNKIEEYGKEASRYTCKLLSNADSIEIEYDSNSDKLDKYDRHLVWIFVDGDLLQEKIIENGLGEVAYLYGDYKYTNTLKIAQDDAKDKKLGIWNKVENKNSIHWIYIVTGISILSICVFNHKIRNKFIIKFKKLFKKQLKKAYKSL